MTRADKAGEPTTTRRPHRSTRLATATLATATVLALVTACGTTEPGPTASPTTSQSATPSPTPTTTALAEPTKPPEMERNDEVGAIAAAEYFIQLHEWAYATGDLTEWDRVSGQTCDFCANAHDSIAGAYTDGAHIENGTSTFSDFSVTDFDEQLAIFSVGLTYTLSESTHIDRAGEVIGTIPEETGTLVLDVAPSVRGWVLMDGVAS